MTPDLAALRDLLARTQTATGPDRDLDRAIAYAFSTSKTDIPFAGGVLGIGSFTSSLDNAIRLAEQALPGCSYTSTKYGRTNVFTLHEPPENPNGRIADPGSWARQHHGGGVTTMPLAILEAVLTALVSQAERQQHAAALSELAASDAELLP